MFKVTATNLSREKGKAKTQVPAIVIDELGVQGDAHAGPTQRQVSLLSKESIDNFAARIKKPLPYGVFGENLTLSGIELSTVRIFDKFLINDVMLQVTQIGKKCHGDVCAIYREVGECIMPKEGVFCRVLKGGMVKPGDEGKYLPRDLKILIITLSDRAYHQVYPDKSGAIAKSLIADFFAAKWQAQIASVLLPDNADLLYQRLLAAIQEQVDVVFTLGGTGIGSKDVTVATVSSLCDKLVPGVMEQIRGKYSANPHALLSCSIFGIAKETQIYTLPGSVRAVTEYLSEIFKILEHAIFMVHDVDVHGQ